MWLLPVLTALLCAVVSVSTADAAGDDRLKLGAMAAAMTERVQATGSSAPVDHNGIFEYELSYGNRAEHDIHAFTQIGSSGSGVGSVETYGTADYNKVFVRRDLLRVSPGLGWILTLKVKRNVCVTFDNALSAYNATNVQMLLTTYHSDGENEVALGVRKINTATVDDGALKHDVHAAAGDTVTFVLEVPARYQYAGQMLTTKSIEKDVFELEVRPDAYAAADRYDFVTLQAHKAAAKALSERFATYCDGLDLQRYNLDKQLELVTLCEQYAAQALQLDLATDLERFEADALAVLAAVPTAEQESAALLTQKADALAELNAYVASLNRMRYSAGSWRAVHTIRDEAERELARAENRAQVMLALSTARKKIEAIAPRTPGATVGLIVGITVGCLTVVTAIVVTVIVWKKKKRGVEQ